MNHAWTYKESTKKVQSNEQSRETPLITWIIDNGFVFDKGGPWRKNQLSLCDQTKGRILTFDFF